MEESIQAWMIFLKHLVTLDSEESFFCSNFAPLKGQPTKKNTHHFGCFFTFFSRRGNVKKDKILASKQPPSIPQLFRIDLSFFSGRFFFSVDSGLVMARETRGLVPGTKGSCWGIATSYLCRLRGFNQMMVIVKESNPPKMPKIWRFRNHLRPICPDTLSFSIVVTELFHAWMVLSISSKKGCWKSAPNFWSMNCSTQFFYVRDTSDHHPYRWSILQKLWRFISWFDDFVIVPDEGFIHFFACLLDSSKIGVFTLLAFQEITKKLFNR